MTETNPFAQFAVPDGVAVDPNVNPFAQFAGPAFDEKAQAEAAVKDGSNRPDYRPQSMFGDRFQRLSDQMTDPFGVQDEIVGAGQFLRKLVTSGGDLSEASQAYSDAAERIRAERNVARGENTVVPEIVGGFGTSGIAKGFQMAPNLLGRIGQSAKAGAGYGGVAGYAQGEGGVANRALSAGEGAAIGAVAGPVISEVAAPAIGAVARATQSTGSAFKNAVQSLRGQGRNVDARLQRALEQQNMTPGQALGALNDAAAAAKFGKTQLDPRFTIADLGPVTRDLADTAALVSGEARAQAGDFLGDRARDQFGRMNDYLPRSLQVTRADFAKTKARLAEEQRNLSKQAYDQAYADKREFDFGQVLFDRQFDDFAAAGPLRRALNRARSLFMEPSRAPGLQAQMSTERFDSGKRALDDMIQVAKQGGRNNEARLLTQLKQDLLGVIDDPNAGNAAYKTARDVYSSRAELLDSLESGRAFMRGDAELTGAQYRQLSTGEKRMFRIGIAREARKVLGGKTLNADALGYFDKPNTRAVLEEIMTPGQSKKFYQLVELEQALAATNQAVRGNSETAKRQQNVMDFSLGVRLGRAIKDRGLKDALVNEVFDGITKAFAMREGDAVLLTRMLFETDLPAQQAIMQRLIQTYGAGRAKSVVNRAQSLVRHRVAKAHRALAGVVGQIGVDPAGQPVPQPHSRTSR